MISSLPEMVPDPYMDMSKLNLLYPFKIPDQGVLHSHYFEYSVPSNYIPILSTRKDKTKICFSLDLALRTDDWGGPKSVSSEIILQPFNIDIDNFVDRYKQVLEKEFMFVERYNPIIVYLEDSVEDIEIKLQHNLPYREKDTTFKSKYDPKDYILNYKEALDACRNIQSNIEAV